MGIQLVPAPPEPDIPSAPPELATLPVAPEPEPIDPIPTYRMDRIGTTESEHVTTLAPLYGRAFVHGASPYDVQQSGLGDCYLLASLAAIAQTRPEILEGMISRAGGRYHESYAVRFPSGYDPVRVSNMFPVRISRYKMFDGTTPKRIAPLYGHSTTAGELWVSILEKAFTARFGPEIARHNVAYALMSSVARLSASYVAEAWDHAFAKGYAQTGRGGYWPGPVLEWLTGGKSRDVAIQRPDIPEDQLVDELGLAGILIQATERRWPVVLCTGDSVKDAKRFLDPHAYALLAFDRTSSTPVRLYETNRATDVDVGLTELRDNFASLTLCVPKGE